MRGDSSIGVSIIEVHATSWDLGDILSQHKMSLPPHQTYATLHDTLAQKGGEMIIDVLSDLDGVRGRSVPQSSSQGWSAFKIGPGTGKLNWADMDSHQVYNLWRAIGEAGEVHTHLTISEGSPPYRVLPRELTPHEEAMAYVPLEWHHTAPHPGTFRYHKKGQLIVAKCREGYVGVKVLQVESKKPQRAVDFVNGYRIREAAFI